MPIEAGGTFSCNNEELTGESEHLWVILTDPTAYPECIIIVNLSSCDNNRRHDPACVLKPGEHWFIRHNTFVYYRGAIALTLRQLIDANISLKTAVTPSILERIRDGASRTDRLSHHIRKHLIEQGIISP
jgi:hypothetical protein